MVYIYKSGKEYLIKYRTDAHRKLEPAKPKPFARSFMSSSKRRKKHAD